MFGLQLSQHKLPKGMDWDNFLYLVYIYSWKLGHQYLVYKLLRMDLLQGHIRGLQQVKVWVLEWVLDSELEKVKWMETFAKVLKEMKFFDIDKQI